MASTLYQIFVRYISANGQPLTNRTQVEWIGAEELDELKQFWAYCENDTEVRQFLNCTKREISNLAIITGGYSERFYKLEVILLKNENDLTPTQLETYQKCLRYANINNRLFIDKENNIVQEHCFIRSYDDLYMDIMGEKRKAAKKLDKIKYQTVIDESDSDNPKYDMIFMYDGIAHMAFPGYGNADYRNPGNETNTILNSYPGTIPPPFLPPEIYFERMKRLKLDPWFFYAQYGSLKAAMLKAEELVGFLGKDAVKIGKVVPLDQYIDIV